MTEPPRPRGEPDLVRPYGAGHTEPAPYREPAEADLLRPYLLTSGRVEPVDARLEIEAQVEASDQGPTGYAYLSFEQRDIVALCQTPMAVAEVAARLNLHIGVVRVLVADLAAAGHLLIRRPAAEPSLELIERVVRGLERIR